MLIWNSELREVTSFSSEEQEHDSSCEEFLTWDEMATINSRYVRSNVHVICTFGAKHKSLKD